MEKVEEYLEDKSRTKSESTINSHGYVLRNFAREIGIEEATKDKIYDYFDEKIEDGMKKTSANQELNIIRSFYDWLRDQYRKQRDNLKMPADEDEMREFVNEQQELNQEITRCTDIIKMDRYRAPDNTGKPYGEDTFKKLLEVANDTDYHLFYLLTYLGLRKSEFYKLKKDNIDLEDQSLEVMPKTSKTYQKRTLYFGGEAKRLIENMIDANGSEYLIGIDADRNFLNRRLDQYEDEIGENLYPHKSRHTFVNGFKQITDDNLLVKRLAGHTVNTDMTGRYSVPVQEKIREMMTGNHFFKGWGIYDGI